MMINKINLRVIFTVLGVFLIVFAQFITINNARAASVNGGLEFFTNRANDCAQASNCDALTQWGIYNCVGTAADGGSFYSNAQNGGYTSYQYETANYAQPGDPYYVIRTAPAYELLSSLIAYYYGVDATGSCGVTVNTALTNPSSIYSVDNIGASFAILSLLYGDNVPSSDFTYYSSTSAVPGGYVHLDTSILNSLIQTLYNDDKGGLVCQRATLPTAPSYNTAMDIRAPFDVGLASEDTNPTRTYLGILYPTPVGGISYSCGCPSVTPGSTKATQASDFQSLIDTNCGNIVRDQTSSAETPTPPSCLITDTPSNSTENLKTPVTFSLVWHIPKPQATEINSADITATGSSSNFAPTNIENGAPTTTVGYNETETLQNQPTNPKTASIIIYSGTMTIEIPDSSQPTQTITCTPAQVSWGGATVVSCATATANTATALAELNAAIAAQQVYITDENTALAAASAANTLLVAAIQLEARDPSPAHLAAEKAYQDRVTTDEDNAAADEKDAANIGQRITTDDGAYAVAQAAEALACPTQPPPTCPPGYYGTPPNCFQNPPPTCPPGYTGTPPNCIQIPSSPVGPESYFSVNGGDTIVGTGFGSGSCTDDLSAGIVASNIGSDPWTGSSDNLATLAPDIINGFASDSTNTSSVGDALTFGNTTNSPYGGSFGSTNGLCSQDYYTTSKNVTGFSKLTSATGSFNLSAVTSSSNCVDSNSVYYCALSGPISISGNPPSGSKAVLYVNGNAEISGTGISIYSNDSSTLTNASSIPLLYVISNGDIYIDSTVTSLDGVYVADNLKDSDKTDNGIIFTCANAGASFSSGSALISNCNSQLTINGALVANQIKFGRTYGDITTVNGQPVASSETDNYGPEVWLSQINNSNYPLTPDYQDITELSPVI